MQSSITLINSEIPSVWVHAANSLNALKTATPYIINISYHPIGIEVDVRVLPGSNLPVLSHDAFRTDVEIKKKKNNFKNCVLLADWLKLLLDIVQDNSRQLGVVKLDFKDPQAARLSQQLLLNELSSIYEALCLRFIFWWNADVIVANNNNNMVVTHSNDVSFISISESETHMMIHEAVIKLKCRLSFGWKLPRNFVFYNKEDIINMKIFIQRLSMKFGECSSSPACVTFAVRYSAVFGIETNNSNNNNIESFSNSVEDLCLLFDNLIQETRRLFTFSWQTSSILCFLSFWRGRDEEITEAQIMRAKSRFPTCTIDVN